MSTDFEKLIEKSLKEHLKLQSFFRFKIDNNIFDFKHIEMICLKWMLQQP